MMNQTDNFYVTRMQREFIKEHGRERYGYLVCMLLSVAAIEQIRKEFCLSFSEVMVWRQIVSLQHSYESFDHISSM